MFDVDKKGAVTAPVGPLHTANDPSDNEAIIPPCCVPCCESDNALSLDAKNVPPEMAVDLGKITSEEDVSEVVC